MKVTEESREQERVRERVYALVEALDVRSQEHELQLGEIDAAFYLLVVERDLIDLIFGIEPDADQHKVIELLLSGRFTGYELDSTRAWMAKEINAMIPASDDHPLVEIRSDDPRRQQIAERLFALIKGTQAEGYSEAWSQLQRRVPMFSNWAISGSLPSLWDPWVKPPKDGLKAGPDWYVQEGSLHFPSINYVTVRVPNADYRGKHLVEFLNREVTGWFAPQLPMSDRAFDIRTKHGHDLLKIESWFRNEGYEDSLLAEHPFGVVEPVTRFEFPFVELHVFAPWPPAEMIAAYYDLVVVGTMEWHERLRGKRNGQSNGAAIRGWAVGLLTKEGGMTRFPAYEQVARLTGTDPGNEKKFLDHVQPIIDRVQIPGLAEILAGKNTWNADRMR